jgi:hypothetical protein
MQGECRRIWFCHRHQLNERTGAIQLLNRRRAVFYLGVPVLVLRIWSKLRTLVPPDSFERP